jgi:polysaccharide export outer membrane protein
MRHSLVAALVAATFAANAAHATAQATAPKPAGAKPPAPTGAQSSVTPPAGYVIGPDDVLSIVFWRDKDMGADVVVRPDGMITLPLINDIKAAGLTPDQLREQVVKAAEKFVEAPNATVVVKQINSRRFYVTGQVGRPGPYPLSGPTTVLQALAMAGGTAEFSKSDRIVVMRTEGGKTQTFKFNYKDVIKGKNLQQNIEIRPGDTIVVP